ncbi:flagellar export protein FliJ [Halosimplex aquaticum]|uniref:Flagellar export protein FliJ n=1 Tax=Halosimplex aquaticum TaxID=3026162 RepID=A0ABD5XZM4_9EURY|nr:flagellar export protein FliJ [Halosimplex aquaticum]
MVGRHRALATLGLALLVVAGGLPASGAVATATQPSGPSASGGSDGLGVDAAATSLALQENNSTRQHDNPAKVSEKGDLIGVRQWLSNRMLDRLSTGAVELDQGQYEQARSLVGDEYNSRLEQFVDVIGETESESDDDSADAFQRAQRSQRNLTERVQRYEQTYDDYQEAVAEGDEAEAREHARQLQRIASDVRRLNRTVVGQYETLENRTGTDLTPATTSIENVTENVTERQQRVDERLFTGTNLTVSADSTTISYTDPLVATGRLTTENGDPVADREIPLRIANRTYTAETDGDGRFRVTYRPRTIRTDRSSLRVRYVPENASEYLASNDSVAVDVEQVVATLSVERATDAAAFGDRVDATARLTIGDREIRGVPIHAAVGDTQLGQALTDRSGTAAVRGRLPAGVPDGNRSLTLSAGGPNAAVTAEPVSQPVVVRSTPTNLTVAAAQTTGETIAVNGTLTTADGLAIDSQPVEVSVGDAVTETVRTGPNGSYDLAVDGGQLGVSGGATVSVRAHFGGNGTNLEEASATTTVAFRNQTGASGAPETLRSLVSDRLPFGDVSPAVLAGLAALVVLLAVLLVLRRRYAGGDGDDPSAPPADPPEPDDDAAADADPEAGPAAASATDGEGPSPDDGLDFAPAESLLAAGDRAAAVRFAYQHLRGHVAADVGAADSDTHWEFYERCRADGMNGERLDAVRDLVEAYEAVEFGEHSTAPDADRLITTVDLRWSSASDD